MDFGAPVASQVNVNPGTGIQTLSALLGMKLQQLQLQQGALTLQQQAAELQRQQSEATSAQITASQQQALSQVNWSRFLNKDGSYDLDSAQTKALQIAPNIGPDFVTRLANMSAGSADTKSAYTKLNQQYQDQMRSTFGSWAGDPKSSISDLATQLEQIEDSAPANSRDSIKQIAEHTLRTLAGPDLITGAPKSLEQQKNAALLYSRAGLAPESVSGPGGLATPAAGTVSNGASVIPVATNRETATTTQSGPAVTALQDIITLPNQQQAKLNRATGRYELVGQSASASSAPSAPPSGQLTAENDPARPSPNAPGGVWASWNNNVANTQNEVTGTRQADAQYGNQMAIASEVRRLSGLTNSGPGTPEWTRMVGSITSRFGGSSGVTDTQTLESFLDRQAASMRSAMGLPATNAGQETSQTIGGNIGMQGGAIQAKNNYNEALAQGLHDYRTGLDKIAGLGGNASPTAVNRFRSAWAASFNPTAYEYYLAKARGDKALMQRIASSVSPAEAKKMQADYAATSRLAQGQP